MKSAEMMLHIVQSEFRRNGEMAQRTKSMMEAAVLSGDVKQADAMYTQHKQYSANYMLLADLMVKLTSEGEK